MDLNRDRMWKRFFLAATVFYGSFGDGMFRTKFQQEELEEGTECGQGLSSTLTLLFMGAEVLTSLVDNRSNNNWMKRQGIEMVCPTFCCCF